jgi:sporulation protein YlmC with PRC-barrel domain
MATLTRDRLVAMRGMDVVDADGERIGSVEDIYYDDETRLAEWIGIGTGIFGGRRRAVPVVAARGEGDAIRVPYTKDLVELSPTVNGDCIVPELENELYVHYGATADAADAALAADLEVGRVSRLVPEAQPAAGVLRRWVWAES